MAEIRHILEKYAGVAIDVLEQNGENFIVEDVVKVAGFLLDTKIEQSKVAEYDDQGRIMARSFYTELDKIGGIANVVAKTLSKTKALTLKAHGKIEKSVSMLGGKVHGKYVPGSETTLRQRAGEKIIKYRKPIATGAMIGVPAATATAMATGEQRLY